MKRPLAEHESRFGNGFFIIGMNQSEKDFRNKHFAVFLATAAIAAVTVCRLKDSVETVDPDWFSFAYDRPGSVQTFVMVPSAS